MSQVDRGGGDPPGKSQVAIGFLRNICMDPPQEAIGPSGKSQVAIGFLRNICTEPLENKRVQLLLKGVRTALCIIL